MVANSSLLITPQLSSMYSTIGTRCHLILAAEPLFGPNGDQSIDRSIAFPVYNHAQDDDRSPYAFNASKSEFKIKPIFRTFVFEAYYKQWTNNVSVPNLLKKWYNKPVKLVAVETVCLNPHMLVGAKGTRMRVPQTFLDAMYQVGDRFILLDYKILIQNSDPHHRIKDRKNVRQIITNAAFLSAMTNVQIDYCGLVYLTRTGTQTLIVYDVQKDYVESAMFFPGGKDQRFLFYDSKFGNVNKFFKSDAFYIHNLQPALTYGGGKFPLSAWSRGNTAQMGVAHVSRALQKMAEDAAPARIGAIPPELRAFPPAEPPSHPLEAIIRVTHRLVNLYVSQRFGEDHGTRLKAFVHFSDRQNWTEEMANYAHGILPVAFKRAHSFTTGLRTASDMA